MALSISVNATTGRISGVTNQVIPPENAGIGDLIFKSSTGDFVVVGCGTATGNTVTVSNKTYTLWGGIYGFVAGMAMVCAPYNLPEKAWGTVATGTPKFNTPPVMRNGKSSATAQMNTARNSNYIKGGSQSPAPTILESAHQATPLSKDNFATNATDDIKARFGTWTEYIRQTLRVLGVPKTPFGAATTGVKVHEFGRWMGKTCGPGSSVGTAMRDCYDYTGPLNTDPAGTWWLPSMFELGELMIDEHLNRLKKNNNTAWASPGTNSQYWSCVLATGSAAWRYRDMGLCDTNSISNERWVRPVTLIRLV